MFQIVMASHFFLQHSTLVKSILFFHSSSCDLFPPKQNLSPGSCISESMSAPQSMCGHIRRFGLKYS